MNVLYDVSVLGSVRASDGTTTGIPRVVEALAHELARRPDCHLELCSSDYLLESLDYVSSHPRLKEYRFSHNRPGAELQRRYNEFQRAISAATGISRLTTRLNRKVMHFAAKINKVSLHPTDLTSLQNADIYHSTYLALPEQVRDTKGLQPFLTIYDTIQIQFPEYCGAGADEWFQTILSSATPETCFLSISEATKADFCNHIKIDPSRVFVTPLAADADLFYPVTNAEELAGVRQNYHIRNAPYVLSLCTIEPRKNIDHAIRCYVRLMQEGKTPDLQLVLAGAKGWSYDHIFAEIDGAEALKDNIVVTGFVANEDLAALYSGALAFVYPSLYEGFGLPPLEAMQCGTPVITSNTSSLPEVVGDAGIMLDPKDMDGMCQSLLRLYQDAELRASLSVKSLERAKQFSWKRCAEETVSAYKAALGQ